MNNVSPLENGNRYKHRVLPYAGFGAVGGLTSGVLASDLVEKDVIPVSMVRGRHVFNRSVHATIRANDSKNPANVKRVSRVVEKAAKNYRLRKYGVIGASALAGAGIMGGLNGYLFNRQRIAAQKKADALNSILESAARQQHQQRSKAMGVGNVGLRELKELSELSALAADGSLKELGFFTKQVPRYGEEGKFEGMKSQIRPVNTAATVAAGAGVGAAGYAAHRGIMDTFGTVAGPGAGEFATVVANRTVPGAYKAAWAAGPRSMANAGVGGIAGGIEKAGAKVGAGGFAGRIGKALRGLKFLKV